ncbi:MAG: hypothetical protein JJV89_03450 [Desulfosarcina sp.]|nr:hypothetical protein [Desulfobacterales bacterium]
MSKKSVIKYTADGPEVVYEERGKPSKYFRLEVKNIDGKKTITKIFEGEK